MLRNNKSTNVLVILDYTILILYGLFVFEAFLRSTTFTINWHPYYHMSLKFLLILLLVGKSLFKFRDNLPLYMILGICSCGFLLAYLQGNHGILLELILFTIAFIDIDFKKLITVFTATVGLSLFIIILSSTSDILNNLIYTNADGINRISFGINYPTDFASYILFLCLAWGFIRKDKITYIEIALMSGLAYGIYHFCVARTSTLCLIIFSLALVIYKLTHNHIKAESVVHKGMEKASSILTLLPLLCSALSIGLSYVWNVNNPLLVKLNSLMSSRLYLGHTLFESYPIKLWGQNIKMKGNGGYTLPWLNYDAPGASGYNFIDSSYLSILFRYGLFVFICVLLLFTLTAFKARKHHDYITLTIIAIISIHCIMEHHMLDFNYNPFMFLFISSYYGYHIKNKASQEVQS